MEIIKEYLDEKTNEYVYEFSATKDEKKELDEICERNNTTLGKMMEAFIKWSINNPIDFAKWRLENGFSLQKGTIGKPFLKQGDIAGFMLKPYKEDKEKFFYGSVEIVDRYGTFEQNEEPSYDIMVENFNNTGKPMFVKHILESECVAIKINREK